MNVKFNKTGKSLQGNVNIIVRATDGHVYQFKSNAIDSLNISSPTAGVTKATFTSKANVKDITDPNNPISLGGNKLLQIEMTDNGEPGSTDTIAITLSDPAGGLLFSGKWNGTRSLEQLLGGGNLQVRPALLLDAQPSAGSNAPDLTADQVAPIVEAAKTLWLSAGLSEEQLEALGSFTVQIDDLGDSELGWENAGVITIDSDAAGYGWFIDSTPLNSVEFQNGAAVDPEAIGKVDLLSAVMHEIGHVIGYDHDSGGFMSETLALGTRAIQESTSPSSSTIDWNSDLFRVPHGSGAGLGKTQPIANFPVFSLEGFDQQGSSTKRKRLFEDTGDVDWVIEN